jgi:hypothetical protein
MPQWRSWLSAATTGAGGVFVFLIHFLDTFDFPELHADDDDEDENRDPENGQVLIDDKAVIWSRGKDGNLLHRPGGRGDKWSGTFFSKI